MTTTHPLAAALAPAVPECPPSAVVDLIVAWANGDGSFNVAAGDLVVHDGRFEVIAELDPYEGPFGYSATWVRFEGNVNQWGKLTTHEVQRDGLVAVRRYTTGVAEAETGSEKEAPVAA